MQIETPAPEAQENKPAPDLEVVTTTPNLELMERADTVQIWDGFRSSVAELKSSIDSVLSADPSLAVTSKIARANRLELRQIRIAITHKHKELKADILARGNKLDGEKNLLLSLIEPYEAQLLAIEDHAERVEGERLDALEKSRSEQFAPYFSPGTVPPPFRAMTDEQFDSALSDAKLLHEAKLEAARKAEEARLAKEKADAAERERVRLENEKLKKEAAEREAAAEVERKKVAAEAAEAAEAARKDREAIQAKADAKAKEDARILAEAEAKAKAEREAAAESARKEREAREKAEAEIQRQKEAETARLAKEESDRIAAAQAPDREKAKALAKTLREIAIPDFSITAWKKLGLKIAEEIEALAARIETASKGNK